MLDHGHRRRLISSRSRGRSAFSLIELLISIAIISLLIGLLMPALGRARERARSTVCMANLRSIGQGTEVYASDDPSHLIPWYTYPQHDGCDFVSKFTPWVFGGFTAPAPKVPDSAADSSLYPVEVRPLNRILAPSVQGFDRQIDVFKCPSDRSSSNPVPDTADPDGKYKLDEDKGRSSWVANGSSFTLNTRFMDNYATKDEGGTGEFQVENAPEYGRRIAPHLVGGKAARFIMWAETDFYSNTAGAEGDPANSKAPDLREGWHMEFSRWSAAFADGHVEYDYFDTRLSTGPDWTIWEPR